MDADDRVIDRRPILVLGVQQPRLAAPTTVGKRPDHPVEAVFDALRERVVGGIGVGEHRVAAVARHRQRVKLGRLERRLVVGAVRVPAFGATPIDLVPELPIGIVFVNPEHRDLRIVRVPGRFRRMRRHRTEVLAIGNEIRDRQLLAAHAHDIVVEPGLVDLVPGRLVHCLDVDPAHLDADLRTQAANLEHRFPPCALKARGSLP